MCVHVVCVCACVCVCLYVYVCVFSFVLAWIPCISDIGPHCMCRAFVWYCSMQASRVTSAGLGLNRSGVFIRSRPFQYTASQQSDLDSFVLYTQAVKLRVRFSCNRQTNKQTSFSTAGQAVRCAGGSLGHVCSCNCTLFCADHDDQNRHLQSVSQCLIVRGY